jgi:hypothetical protein
MSLQFEPFKNDWVDLSEIFDNKDPLNSEYEILLPVNLSIDFFKNLKLDKQSLKEYRIEAAVDCAKELGSNIALSFSGGIDSQIALLSFLEAGVSFTPYIFVFNNNLNKQDVDHARRFCAMHNVKLNELKIDIIKFLNTENYDIGLKYQSASPHFNTHYKLFDELKSMGYTGVVCGGQMPMKNDDTWGMNFTRNTYNFLNYTKISGFKCQGSFISYDPKLSWAMALVYRNLNLGSTKIQTGINRDDQVRIGYAAKINAYIRSGYNVLPQKKKYTGFEYVKLHYARKYKDAWTFEKKFRNPLNDTLKIYNNKVKFKFYPNVENYVNELHYHYSSDKILLNNYVNIHNSFSVEYLKHDYMRSWL